MAFQRIWAECFPHATLVRLEVPPPGSRYDGPELRDELTRHAAAYRDRILVVDLGDVQSYPAEVLACLAHLRSWFGPNEPIRCVNLPLRLQAASRWLRFDGTILETYDTLAEALATDRPRDVPCPASLISSPPSTTDAKIFEGDPALDGNTARVFLPTAACA